VIDIADPSNPINAGSYDTPGDAFSVFVSGNYAYLADCFSLMILRLNPTDVEEPGRPPQAFALSQNYPNPFNAQTTIQYSLSNPSDVTIDIFDILGRKIETLAERIKPAGSHQAIWDASGHSSGIYFYRIKAGDKVETNKMVLMK
jgi:hypothetical protein